jgi:hypothetical protein
MKKRGAEWRPLYAACMELQPVKAEKKEEKESK